MKISKQTKGDNFYKTEKLEAESTMLTVQEYICYLIPPVGMDVCISWTTLYRKVTQIQPEDKNNNG